MTTVAVTEDTFGDVVGKRIAVLDFWAEWCGPCQMFGPIFEEVSAQIPDVTFGKIDTEENQNLCGALGISSIPTVMVFHDNTLVYRHAGVHSAGQLKEVIQKTRELDMDEVRRKIAELEAATEKKI